MPSGVRRKRHERSSIPRNKVRKQKKTNKMPVKTHPIIAANWDTKLTLEQNYRKLGLTAKLGKRAGGVEKIIRPYDEESDSESENEDKKKTAGELKKGEGRIIRHADGSVTVEYSKADLRSSDDEEEDEDEQNENDSISNGGEETLVVQQLKSLAASAKAKPRSQSEREQDWIAVLVEKHGEDYEAMFHDRKLNIYQQTVGDLKRRIKKWKKDNDNQA